MGCCASRKGAELDPSNFNEKVDLKNREVALPLPVEKQPSLKKKETEKEEEKISPQVEEVCDEGLIKTATDFLKTLVSLVQSVLGRNQATKMFIGSCKSIQDIFTKLKKKEIKTPKSLVTELISVTTEALEYCEKTKKSKKSSGGQKSQKTKGKAPPKIKFSSIQTKEINIFNHKLNDAYLKLKQPLDDEKAQQKEDLENKKKQEAKALEGEKLLARAENLMKNIEENKIQVVGLAQNDLTNEEAFLFWMESFPGLYLVSVEKFEEKFKEWVESHHYVTLSKESTAAVIRLINSSQKEEEEKETITAKDFNTFIEHLPYDIDWEHLEEAEQEIAEDQKERVQEVNEKRKAGELMLMKKVEEMKFDETKEEKELANDEEYTRFLVKGAWTFKEEGRTEYQVRNVFINSITGELLCFGKDQKGEFRITGSLDWTGALNFTKTYVGSGESLDFEGTLSENEYDGTLALCAVNNDEGDTMICLDVDHWFGYYVQYGISDMKVNFKVIGDQMTGVSLDQVGAAIWFGKITPTELHMKKQYVCKHSVDYDGKLEKKGMVTVIKGDWNINRYTGTFYLSHNDEEVD